MLYQTKMLNMCYANSYKSVFILNISQSVIWKVYSVNAQTLKGDSRSWDVISSNKLLNVHFRIDQLEMFNFLFKSLSYFRGSSYRVYNNIANYNLQRSIPNRHISYIEIKSLYIIIHQIRKKKTVARFQYFLKEDLFTEKINKT